MSHDRPSPHPRPRPPRGDPQTSEPKRQDPKPPPERSKIDPPAEPDDRGSSGGQGTADRQPSILICASGDRKLRCFASSSRRRSEPFETPSDNVLPSAEVEKRREIRYRYSLRLRDGVYRESCLCRLQGTRPMLDFETVTSTAGGGVQTVALGQKVIERTFGRMGDWTRGSVGGLERNIAHAGADRPIVDRIVCPSDLHAREKIWEVRQRTRRPHAGRRVASRLTNQMPGFPS